MTAFRRGDGSGRPEVWPWFVRLLAALIVGTVSASGQEHPPFVWGADAEGGAPFAEAASDDPSRVVGFDADIAALIAEGLGRPAQFRQTGFASLEASVLRGDFDLALGGLEDSPLRRTRLAVTIPYYRFQQTLTVRLEDADRLRALKDLAGLRVGTLGASLAHQFLESAATEFGVVPVIYEDDVHPYDDLAQGRVDAVLLDAVLASRAVSRRAGLFNQAQSFGTGHYVGVLAPSQAELRDRIDTLLLQSMRDGRLERIFRRWGVWNADQTALYDALLLAGQGGAQYDRPPLSDVAPQPITSAFWGYLPALGRAAAVTLGVSVCAMLLAIVAGSLIATGRLYGPRWLRLGLTAWVELVRGTPLLLQLFVLYFGLASFVRLPALAAAIVGLGLNYAAYESEVYRAALEAVPSGLLDAAQSLGFKPMQTLLWIRAPLGMRYALAPTTNDFVALLKDSSLVSVITVVELTKQASILATNVGSWVLPGLLCASIYLALSLPLGYLARRLESRWRLS